MPRVGLLGSTIASTRRRGALSLFRLASVLLRGTIGLYKKRLSPRATVKAALSIAALLTRGPRRCTRCMALIDRRTSGGKYDKQRSHCRTSPPPGARVEFEA